MVEETEHGGASAASITSTKNRQASNDKVGIDDVGKGLILMAGILLLSYFALLFLSALVQVEPGQMIWTMPSYMFGTVALSMVLIVIGLVLLRINAKRERA
jgi:hypothetical protein